MEKINKFQKKIIKLSKQFIHREKIKKINVSESPICFFTVWAETPGMYQIYSFFKKKNFRKYFFYIKNILSIYKNHNLKIFYNELSQKFKYSNLIISYSKKQNFDKNGNFFDEYFDYNSKDKNFFWLLISLDNYCPIKIKENIAIISHDSSKKIGILYLLNSIFIQIFFKFFNVNYIKHYCWEEYNYSKKICSLFSKFISNFHFKNIIMNYESIPFQNKILNYVYEYNNKITTYGYLHCAPWPLQTDLIYRYQKINNLLVSSHDQKEILIKELGWNNKKIKVIPSLRFKRKEKK